ncbi:MAG: sensor histidine kinase [Acidimicrobiales bacterium]
MAVALGYRTLVTLVAAAITASSADVPPSSKHALGAVTAAVAVVHLTLVFVGTRRDLHSVPPRLVALDFSVAALLNIWASASVIPDGALFRGFGDPFGAYGIATLALWSALRGPRTGVGYLFGVMLPVQALMVGVNHAALDASARARFVMRSLWLLAALAVGLLLWNVLRAGRTAITAQSELAGRREQRRRMLDALHNVVLQTLIGIERRAAGGGTEFQKALDEIGRECRRRAAQLRAHLGVPEHEMGGLIARFERAGRAAESADSVTVSVRSDGNEPSLALDEIDALVSAVGEAVNNARRHASATSITIESAAEAACYSVRVSDSGVGFDPSAAPPGYGIRNAIVERLAMVGGTATLRTGPSGTTWDFVIPVDGTGGTGPPRNLEPLVDRTVAAAGFIPLAYRIIGLLIGGAGLIGSHASGPARIGPILSVMAAVAFMQGALLAVVARRPNVLVRRWVFASDVTALALLSLWSAGTLPDGTVYLDNRDPFTVYAQGTVALWTGFGSTRTGAALLFGIGIPLQLTAAAVNGVALGATDWLALASRALWLVAAFLLARGIVAVVRSGAGMLASERHRAGLEAERSDALAVSGKEIITTLDEIAEQIRERAPSPALLFEVGELARRRALDVRIVLRTGDLKPGLQAELEAMAASFERDDQAEIEVVALGLDGYPRTAATARLANAVREVLQQRRAGAPRRTITVFAERRVDGVSVLLRDPTSSTGGEGLLDTVAAHLTNAGDRATRTLLDDGGCVWELTIGEEDREDAKAEA